MNKSKFKLFLILLVFLILYSISTIYVLFPSDVLMNIPNFSEDGWERPKNSLLADSVYQFEPWRGYAKEEIRQGRFPLWNDLNGHGVPLFANSQSAVLYPLNLIYYIFPDSFALLLIPISKLSILFTGAYLYLREIKMKKEISIIGGCAVTFAAFPLTWLLWPHTNVYILLPLLLFITEKVLHSKKNTDLLFTIISFLYFFAILGGHPETLLHILLIHIAYVFFRFWKNLRKYKAFMISILSGFALGAIQIFPFIEYLLNSNVLHIRSTELSDHVLPLKSFIFNFFPFILGAPQLEIYKPVTNTTNFQETVGGYVGLVVIISALYWLFKSKNSLVKFWGVVVLASWLFSYKIWPLYLINQLPLIRLVANHRIVAYAGFGLVIIFSIFLQEYKNHKPLKAFKVFFSTKFYTLFLLISTIILGLSNFTIVDNLRLSAYINTIKIPLFIMTISTYIFLRAILYGNKKIIYLIYLSVILLQGSILFWNYNPLTQNTKYYPDTTLTNTLKKLPPGTYLEVGNPALPANINLKYGLRNIQNYDAIEIKSFKKEFDKRFSDKNSWGNPEDIDYENIQKMKIDYIVSDYNINLTKQKIQNNDKFLFGELVKGNEASLKFEGNGESIDQLRIKTATFNRNNNCKVNLKIKNSSGNTVYKNEVKCSEFRNNMFYTINTYRLVLKKGEKYIFTLTSDVDYSNAISVYGNQNKEPFLQLLFNSHSGKKYKLLQKTRYYYLFKPNEQLTEEKISIRLLSETPEKRVYDLTSKDKATLILPMSHYPGWKASLNGFPTDLYNKDGFLSLNVPKGKSLIILTYFPSSFLIGTIISLLSLFAIVFFIMRKEKRFIKLILEQKVNLRNKIRKISFGENILISTLSVIVAVILLLILIISFPVSFNNTSVITISWYTKNNISKAGEYFYFYTGFTFVFIGSSLLWILYIWRKK